MLQGTGVALVTPFKPAESRDVDYDALAKIIDNLTAAPVDFIVAFGSTAETPTLSPDETSRLADFIARKVDGRIKLVYGLGGNNTAAVARRLAALDPDGPFSAVLSVAPFYNKPTQAGLYAHFHALADASPLPIVLYNVPSRTGVNIAAETTLRLAADCRRIVGIKEASGNLSQIGEILRCRPEGFSVLSGDDALTLALIAMGADGVISVIANAFPRQFSLMVSAALNGNIARARALDAALRPFYAPLSADGNPAGIKTLLNLLGLASPAVRLPLVEATKATRDCFAKVIEKTIWP